MLSILLRKTTLFISSIIVLLGLTFWFHVRVRNLGDSELLYELFDYLQRIFTLDFGISNESDQLVLEMFVPAGHHAKRIEVSQVNKVVCRHLPDMTFVNPDAGRTKRTREVIGEFFVDDQRNPR